jgi:hypothetical protein
MVASIPEELRQEIIGSILLGRFAAPAEMATVGFLVSGTVVHQGVVLPVDGSMAM